MSVLPSGLFELGCSIPEGHFAVATRVAEI